MLAYAWYFQFLRRCESCTGCRKWAEEITKPQWSEEDKDAVDITEDVTFDEMERAEDALIEYFLKYNSNLLILYLIFPSVISSSNFHL